MKLLMALAILGLGLYTSIAQVQPSLRFKASGPEEFSFDTGVLRGTLRAGGASKGLSSVEHIPSGTRLDSSMGLFSHYRLLAKNQRFGDAAWKVPSQAHLQPDGSVSIEWPGATDRPFVLGARYRWAAPNILDLETSLQATTNLSNIEVFLSSYFAAGFTNAAVWTSPEGEAFTRATPDLGHWLAFPRDDNTFKTVQDGRWTHPPSPVDWERVKNYCEPLAFRTSSEGQLSAVVMATRQSCFSVMTPFETESHRSLYLALFGQDAQKGQTLKASARLVIATNLSHSAAMELYRDFSKQHAKSNR